MTGRQKLTILFMSLSPEVLAPVFRDFLEPSDVWAISQEINAVWPVPNQSQAAVVEEFEKLLEVHGSTVAQVLKQAWLNDGSMELNDEERQMSRKQKLMNLFVRLPPELSPQLFNALNLKAAPEITGLVDDSSP